MPNRSSVLTEGATRITRVLSDLSPYFLRLNALRDRPLVRARRGSSPGLACVEKRRDQREYFAGPPYHADVRGPGEHDELGVRQEFEHLHHVGQW